VFRYWITLEDADLVVNILVQGAAHAGVCREAQAVSQQDNTAEISVGSLVNRAGSTAVPGGSGTGCKRVRRISTRTR
jgi:hypothetical protein